MRTFLFEFYRCVRRTGAFAKEQFSRAISYINPDSFRVERIPYPDENTSPEWLREAIQLDSHLVSACDGLEPVFKDVLGHNLMKKAGGDGKHAARFRHTAKVILINLYVGYKTGVPIHYSRDNNEYSPGERYRLLYFSRERTLAIIDSLYQAGFIHQKKGFYDKNSSFQSRMWASAKLILLFEGIERTKQSVSVMKTVSTELIRLNKQNERNNNKKTLVDYNDNANTNRMRRRVERYNDFINDYRVGVRVDETESESAAVTFKQLSDLLAKHHNGTITITLINDTGTIIDRYINSENLYGCNDVYNSLNNAYSYDSVGNIMSKYQSIVVPDSIGVNRIDTIIYSNTTNNNIYINKYIKSNSKDNVLYPLLRQNHCFSNDNDVMCANLLSGPTAVPPDPLTRDSTPSTPSDVLVNLIAAHRLRKVLDCEKNTLARWGIRRLWFDISPVSLHRVFNRGSFSKGGRFYGSYHDRMPKALRKRLVVNGQPTVEIDYSAHHIRILYHREGIDYRGDPYEAVSNHPHERDIFKLLLLVILNADSERDAVYAFQKKAFLKCFDESSLCYGKIKELIRRFKDVHKPIVKHMHKDYGTVLQNIDSEITESILMAMVDRKVPCLPVHDSYIVPVEHENLLREVMISAYRKSLGFMPVVK